MYSNKKLKSIETVVDTELKHYQVKKGRFGDGKPFLYDRQPKSVDGKPFFLLLGRWETISGQRETFFKLKGRRDTISGRRKSFLNY